MLAVSSSFDVQKSGMFADMDAALSTNQIFLYNKVEWEAVAQHYRNAGTIPDHATLSDDNLFKLTGRVPRLLMMVKANYLGNGKSWSNRIYSAVDSKIVSYFTERIRRVIERHKEKYVFEFAARAVINQYKYGSLSDKWVDSGIFERSDDDDEVNPISPGVLRAMYECVSTEMDSVIQLLAETECCGTAFEMFIKLGFFKQKELKFPVKYLDGTESSSELKLSIFNKVDQDMPANDESIGEKYSSNTMVICYQNHPVVDVVIYCQGVVNFVSVSIQSYTAHRTNFDDFWNSKVGNSNYSILEYYCRKSPYSESATVANAKRWTEKLKSLVKFIFITPDTTKHRPKNGPFQDVIRINGESLNQFGTSAKYFQHTLSHPMLLQEGT